MLDGKAYLGFFVPDESTSYPEEEKKLWTLEKVFGAKNKIRIEWHKTFWNLILSCCNKLGCLTLEKHLELS